MRRWFIAALLALCAVALNAQGLEVTTVANLPACVNGSPWIVLVVDGNSSTDCATGGSTTEVVCTCKDGVIAGLSTSGGSSNSFETMNAPAGTDPVADSSTDTLNWTAGTGITITGDSSTDTLTVASTIPDITFDIGDDGGDDSTAVAEISTVNDNGGAITEPSADEIQIDVSKLRPPSALNPRASPHANDCEFSSGICGSWTLDGGYGSGTVDPMVQVSGGDIYDCSTWPGWCLFQDYQNGGATAYKAAVYKSHTPAAEETWWFHVTAGGGINNTNENRVGLCYLNTGDSNEEVCAGFHSSSGNERVEIYVSNNGAVTAGCAMNTVGVGSDDIVMILRRDGDVYNMGFMRTHGGGGMTVATGLSAYYCGSVTKTGVTTFDQIALVLGDSNESATPPQGVDFIRYKADINFSGLMLP